MTLAEKDELRILKAYTLPFGNHRGWSLGTMLATPGKTLELKRLLEWLEKTKFDPDTRADLAEAKLRITRFLQFKIVHKQFRADVRAAHRAKGVIVGAEQDILWGEARGTRSAEAQRVAPSSTSDSAKSAH